MPCENIYTLKHLRGVWAIFRNAETGYADDMDEVQSVRITFTKEGACAHVQFSDIVLTVDTEEDEVLDVFAYHELLKLVQGLIKDPKKNIERTVKKYKNKEVRIMLERMLRAVDLA